MTDSYFTYLGRCFVDLKDNLTLFLPYLFLLLFFVGVFFLSLLELFVVGLFGLLDFKLVYHIVPLINSITSGGVALIVVFGVINLVLMLLGYSYMRGMLLGMFREIIDKRKTSINTMMKSGKKYWKKLFFIQLLILIFFFIIPLVVLGSVVALVFLASVVAGIVVGLILGVIFILYLIFIGIVLLFVNPILVDKFISPAREIIRATLVYFKAKLGCVLITWLITLLIAIVASLFNGIINVIFTIPRILLGSIITFVVISFIVRLMISLVSSIITDNFLFYIYFKKNKI